MIIIKIFYLNLLKIDKRSYKIYYIGYITMRDFDYAKVNSANPLYLIISKGDGYIQEINGDKYLVFASTDENKKVLTKYTKLWDEIEYLMKTTKGSEAGENKKDFMKIKFNSYGNLPLNKILKFHNLTVVVRSAFEKDGKYYLHVF